MKRKYETNSLSMQFSTLTTRNQTQLFGSLDSNIESLWSTSKNTHERKKTEKAIADILFEKHSKSQAKLWQLRRAAKAKEIEELKQAPSLNPGTRAIIKAMSQAEVQNLIESISVKSKKGNN